MPTVLVVDNDIATLQQAEGALRGAGHKVEMATSARAALRVLSAADIDAVLLEVILPEMEGVETIIELQRQWPQRPIVAMSGGGNVITSDHALQLAKAVGASATLKKPFTARELLAAVEGALASAAA
jgi:DNA-binding response OmpR family regulator